MHSKFDVTRNFWCINQVVTLNNGSLCQVSVSGAVLKYGTVAGSMTKRVRFKKISVTFKICLEKC